MEDSQTALQDHYIDYIDERLMRKDSSYIVILYNVTLHNFNAQINTNTVESEARSFKVHHVSLLDLLGHLPFSYSIIIFEYFDHCQHDVIDVVITLQ